MVTKLNYKIYFLFIIFTPTNASARGLYVYVIGGTGDLAKRYLWPGFFELYKNHPEKNIRFYGAAKSAIINSSAGELTPFQELVKQTVMCTSVDHLCSNHRENFIKQLQYIQLRTELQYKELCTSILQSSCDVIFYLSVPPLAYEKIVQMISPHCDLRGDKRTYKFIFEKPFGINLESAHRLSSLLDKYLDEAQIYRVDHYLGKETVSKILEFRRNNQQLDDIMNKKYVKEIDVVVSETLGCKDRTSYYDKSGVVRDMLQSHLTEVLCHITMDVSKEDGKLQILTDIQTVSMRNVKLAQYKGYKNETAMENNIGNSNTPTFAAVEMKIKSERWKNVPTKLVSGKHLNERTGYGRIVFKRKYFPTDDTGCLSAPPQVIFLIRHETMKSPAILISRVLPFNHNYVPNHWQETTKYHDMSLFGNKGSCFRIFIPKTTTEAYTHLIAKLYEEDRLYFVPVDQLIESWRIWSPLVTEVASILNVREYEKGSTMLNILQFDGHEMEKCYLANIMLFRCQTRPTRFSFLGFPAIVAPMCLLTKTLAGDLKFAAQRRKNTDFHLALSGGNSPLKLYDYIRKHKYNFPWSRTHIWQVDERCSEMHSNFEKLKSHLLDFMPEIDSMKIHPMPTFFNGKPCPPDAATMYENILLNLTTSKTSDEHRQIDFVLLGLGADGHTASLFPGMYDMLDTGRYVVSGHIPGILSPRRMTLTFKTINSAENIAILVSGKSKCEILKDILNSKLCGRQYAKNMSVINKFPLCGIINSGHKVRWYIEEEAFECT